MIDPVRQHWTWAAESQRSRTEIDDAWSALTTEPEGVEYRKVDAGGTTALWVEPVGADPDAVVFFIHGGGFVSGSPWTHRKLAGHLAKAAGTRALLVGYGLAPEHRYPEPLDEITRAYEWLLAEGVAPTRTAIGGDSVGAWLALSLALRLRDRAVPLPSALLLISSWVDLTQSGATYTTNADVDPFFTKPLVDMLATTLLADVSAKDPAVDLLQADYTGLPPMNIQVGGDETLLDDSRALDARARAAGVETHLTVFPGQLHTFQMAAGNLPIADQALTDLATWLRPRLTSA